MLILYIYADLTAGSNDSFARSWRWLVAYIYTLFFLGFCVYLDVIYAQFSILYVCIVTW